MLSFSEWVEKRSFRESYGDDASLVRTLNETYSANRALVDRMLREMGEEEVGRRLMEMSPGLWQRLKGLGPKAMMTAMLGLGGVGAEVGSEYLDAVGKSRQLAGPHAAAVKGLQDMETRRNLGDRRALWDLADLGREEVKNMQSAAAVEKNADERDEFIAQHGPHGLGFGYTDTGYIAPKQLTAAQQWQAWKDHIEGRKEVERKEAEEKAAREAKYKQYLADLDKHNAELQRARDTRVRVSDTGQFTVTNPPVR